jgi:hypothetical protein
MCNSRKIVYALRATSLGGESATVCYGACGRLMHWSANGHVPVSWVCFATKINGCDNYSGKLSTRCDGQAMSGPQSA